MWLKLYENLKIFGGEMNELHKFDSLIMLDILDTGAWFDSRLPGLELGMQLESVSCIVMFSKPKTKKNKNCKSCANVNHILIICSSRVMIVSF